MGSLDAYLVAAGFSMFGQQVWVIRLVQGALYLATMGVCAQVTREIFHSWTAGLITCALLVFPPVNVTLYTSVSLGGYNEALLIGCVLLWTSLRIANKPDRIFLPFLWGLAAGLGLWTLGITAIFSLVSGIYWLTSNWMKVKFRTFVYLAAALIGGLLGSFPWWFYAIQNGPGKLLSELFGSAVAVEGGAFLSRVGQHFVNLALLGLPAAIGIRPPWNVTWLAWPLVPFVVAVWVIVLIFSLKLLFTSNPLRSRAWMLAGVDITLIAAFLLTSFGADPSGRYFLPIYIVFAIFAAGFLWETAKTHPRFAWGIGALLIIYPLAGNIQCALKNPPALTTQFDAETQVDHRVDPELISFLNNNGITRGYTDYWAAYPLAFTSQEKLIFVPRLPYHSDLRYTPRDDRYAPYDDLVQNSPQVAYITTNHTLLDERIRNGFKVCGLTWSEKQIGDYLVFYRLSQRVSPEELKIGTGG
jgi:hypothetical protein